MLPYFHPISLAIYALSVFTYICWQKYCRNKKIRAWGCEEAQHQVSGLRYGFSLLRAAYDRQWLPFLEQQHHQYGHTFRFSMANNNMIFTISPDNIQTVLSTKFSDFGMAPSRQRAWKPFLGKGIFTLDGEAWSHSRKMITPMFAQKRWSDFTQFDRLVDRFLAGLPTDGSTIDIEDQLEQLFLMSTTNYFLGEDAATSPLFRLNGSEQNTTSSTHGQRFSEAIKRSERMTAWRTILSQVYWVFNTRTYHRDNRTIQNFADYFADRAVERRKMGKVEQSDPGFTYLDSLAEHASDRQALRSQISQVFIAASRDPPSLLASTFYLLARHPRVWDKLQAEIREVFGDDLSNPREEINMATLSKMSYLRHVLDEALRLIPPVPFNMRVALRDTTLPMGGGPDGSSPIFIRKGDRVCYSTAALHKREDIWGSDACAFRPERWEDLQLQPCEFIPFNFGPRICPGQHYAIAQTSYVLVKVMQRFNGLEPAQADQFPVTQPIIDEKLTTSHYDGVSVRLLRSASA
ncbi:cytochrome P450 [Aspergillus saccharolyticus JOP 1030-1]|uniref:Cytochrome P450 n=1 Tax=Aspergillus saccharolyticus JOP 1030-1 TaxID=1450539 RepID=A0A318ZW49_9EURO|nr:cytochrome P450 [Aspergillus saccharolyticus JOP 1030-1]PYH48573.1 cytochrome P450 [Aspergillus saccharolyticus JOP 1030-1]